MLAHRRTVAPRANFVVGTAERLPFAPASFDLVTAAGALNYADVPAALDQVARVLVPGGRLVVYDFSEGRDAETGDALGTWFDAFQERFPFPPGWRPLEVRDLPLTEHGLGLLDYTAAEIRLPMTFDGYLRYALGGNNVDDTIARGVCSAREAHDWCRETLEPVFTAGPVTVLIPGYVATISTDAA